MRSGLTMIYQNKSALKLIRFIGAKLFSTSPTRNQSNGAEHLSIKSLQSKDVVLTEKYRAVTIISLNRPDKKNAMNKEMIRALAKAMRAFDEDEQSSVGILCGVGGNFSVGPDLEEISAAMERKENILDNLTFEQSLTEKPLLCCISGYCLSMAVELALMCDIRLVEDSAVMQFSNRQLGIPLLNGGPQRLAQLIGGSRAADLIVTGREIKAAEANEIGLANYTVTDGSCLGRALGIASSISSFPPSTLKYDKRNLYASLASSTSEKLDALPPEILADIRAGLAFAQKKKQLAYLGSKRATRHFTLEQMPQWEQDEYARELEYINKTSHSK